LEVEDRDHSVVTTAVSGGFMSLTITSRIVSGVVIMDLSGRLCFLEVSLREHVNELLEEGYREFVLNLADVPYIDSFGLGQLVTIWTSIRGNDGQLAFLRPTDHVQHLFQISKLNTIFHILGDEEQAVRSARMSSPVSA
jgi:anti-sigma B factor antagonist